MDIIKFKGCKRCGGDLFLERDFDGEQITCLQCGTVYNQSPEVPGKKAVRQTIERPMVKV
ncbi:MAG: hypothetical protein PHG35_02465 [Dehalococcoidales bacterium]|nr:hypothetical protein [Dehalococcoidales bacterium]